MNLLHAPKSASQKKPFIQTMSRRLAMKNIHPMPSILAMGFAATLLFACTGGDSGETSTSDAGNLVPLAKVTLVSMPAATTTDPYARFEFHADGAARIECALDGGAFVRCASPLQLPMKQSNGLYSALSTGVHRLQLRAVDSNGTTSAMSQFEWTIGSIFEKASADFSAQRLIDGEVLPLLASESDAGWKGIFRINCEFDHAAYDDPIVFPGKPGAAHLHMFWGAKNIDAHTDFETLNRAPAAGCSGGVLNRSGYWFPALLAPKFNRATNRRDVDAAGEGLWEVVMPKVGEGAQGSREAADAHEVFYYSAAVDDLSSIQSPPIGLRIIAGDGATLPGSQQPASVARWHCRSWNSSDAKGGPWSATIPECKLTAEANGNTVGDMLRFDIFFPSCWNGRDLDSANHKDHMAYPTIIGRTLQCPGTHPVAVARISFHYAFPILPSQVDPTTKATTGWRLASDNYVVGQSNGGLSLHGDWFNGWHPEAMDALIKHCIQGRRDCHDGNFAWLNSGVWQSSVSLGRLLNAKGTGTIPAIFNGGLGSMHSH
jgi:hypothetical protein